MSDPWDRPPIPPRGDDFADITYAAVGGFLSQWEKVEIELSDLYAIFTSRPNTREAYEDYYNEARSLASRIALLDDSAERFFVKCPSQVTEGEFANLKARVSGFSERRHEIAHGVVRPYFEYAVLTEWSDPLDQDQTRTCLAPPYYQRNWFDKTLDLPKYVYVGSQIDRITVRLADLAHDVAALKERVELVAASHHGN